MHHSPQPDTRIRDVFPEPERKLFGPTGQFPGGKLTPHDEGEIRFGVAVTDGKVVVAFNTPVAWMGMDAEQAIRLGGLLIAKGKQLRKGKRR